MPFSFGIPLKIHPNLFLEAVDMILAAVTLLFVVVPWGWDSSFEIIGKSIRLCANLNYNNRVRCINKKINYICQ